MEPSVSVPSDTATRLAATEIADPLLDPNGSADKTYGFCNISRFAELIFVVNNLTWPDLSTYK